MRVITAILVSMLCCVSVAVSEPFIVIPRDESTRVEVQTASPIGRLEVWAPEAIMSERGACAIYPTGSPWRKVEGGWEQRINKRKSYGPGNYTRVGDEIECVGEKFPADSPVSWVTRLTPGPQRVDIEIRLTNRGKETIHRAAAAVCVKFLDADWWSDDTTFAECDGKPTTLANLGREVGKDDRFEAYLVRGQKFPNPFYVAFWGFNRRTIDRPLLVSEHRTAGLCAIVASENAYFMHSNQVNPCTDAMLAFGDVAPGAEATARGYVSVERGSAKEVFAKTAKP